MEQLGVARGREDAAQESMATIEQAQEQLNFQSAGLHAALAAVQQQVRASDANGDSTISPDLSHAVRPSLASNGCPYLSVCNYVWIARRSDIREAFNKPAMSKAIHIAIFSVWILQRILMLVFHTTGFLTAI